MVNPSHSSCNVTREVNGNEEVAERNKVDKERYKPISTALKKQKETRLDFRSGETG